MMVAKTSAVADEPIEVLVALHNKFDLMDMAGPVETLFHAQHDIKDACKLRWIYISHASQCYSVTMLIAYFPAASKAFEITLAGDEPKMLSNQGVIISAQISYKEAHERIKDFDVVIVLGGSTQAVLDQKNEPLQLITAYSELQKADPTRERTLMSICAGSLLLAEQGILAGLSATTHPDVLTKFERICSNAATRDLTERTDVIEDARYVVNNLRFDLGNEDENPYIRRKSDARRTSNARYVSPQPTWHSLH